MIVNDEENFCFYKTVVFIFSDNNKFTLCCGWTKCRCYHNSKL